LIHIWQFYIIMLQRIINDWLQKQGTWFNLRLNIGSMATIILFSLRLNIWYKLLNCLRNAHIHITKAYIWNVSKIDFIKKLCNYYLLFYKCWSFFYSLVFRKHILYFCFKMGLLEGKNDSGMLNNKGNLLIQTLKI
jgi:hypothetical protein